MGEREGAGDFAAELRRLREAASLTQEELAERAGLTVNAIGALERGERRRPYPHTVRALAQALELDEPARAMLAARVPPRTRPDRPAAAGGAPAMPAAPPEPTDLIGREGELALVEALILDGGSRLVTLTGPGGVGKTRLATAVAARCRVAFPDGVAFVDLTAVRDAALVLPAIASAVGLRETAGRPVGEALPDFLDQRRPLVVLDNLEHLLGCAADLAELIARCPRLVVLATSRGPLRIRAEREVPVPPLALPGPRAAGDVDLDTIAASPAVRLFLDRSTAAGAALSLTTDNAADVAAICRRFEGLPLAIELASVRSRLLPPAALLSNLDEALTLPGPRDLPERQRTMRATLQWSSRLLAPAAQRLLGRAAGFVGSFSLEGAAAVLGESGREDVLSALSDLRDQALVVPTTGIGGTPRYRLLEPVRHFALELLEADGADRARGAAASHLVDLAAEAAPELRTGAQVSWLDRLTDEHGNLRAALSHLLEAARTDEAASLVWDTWLYWALRGHAGEAVEQADAVAAAAASDLARCRALAAASALLYVTGDIPRMRERAEPAIVLARDLEHPALTADTALLAGVAAVFDQAAASASASPLLAEAVARGRDVGAEWTVTHGLAAQGQLALLEGDLPLAARLLQQAEDAARRIGGPFSLATVLNIRATLTELTGEHDASADLLTEALDLSVRASINWTLVYTLPALAGVVARSGHLTEAAQLFGAGAALAEAHSIDPSFPATRALADRDLTAVRRALGGGPFESAWRAGHAVALADPAALLELVAPVRQTARTRAM